MTEPRPATKRGARTGSGRKYGVEVTGGTVGAIGDYNKIFNLFLKPPAELKDYIRAGDFQVTVDDRTRSFVGREFVFDGIVACVKDSDFPSGYIVIQGEPGIGKTAVLSAFIKRSRCVHHLHISGNVTSTTAFLSNVCAQLMIRDGIKENLPERASLDSGYLTGLLRIAAKKSAYRPVIVAVDALDESDHAHGTALPKTLPDGVFFVVTMRAGSDISFGGARRHDIYIQEDDPLHRQDVMAFVERYIADHSDTMPQRIAGWQVTAEMFKQILMDKSEGNFMYLTHVLRDINGGRISKATLEDVQELPSGLKDYYKDHWDHMRSEDPAKFTNYQQPVICLLAVAREPVTRSYLTDWTEEAWAGIEDVSSRPPMKQTARYRSSSRSSASLTRTNWTASAELRATATTRASPRRTAGA